VLLDWGRPVEGHLSLRLGNGGLRTALLFTGAEAVDPLADGPGAAPDAAVIVVPDRRGWTDVVPRRFRYVAVLGATPVVEAWVDPPLPWETVREPAGGRRAGLFGIAPPPLRTPVEDEVWRQLKGLARGRER
jgi:hypothetical protein